MMTEAERQALQRDLESVDEPDMPDRYDFEPRDYEREVYGREFYV